MRTENKKCWSCGNFDAYYIKGYCRFEKTNNGFCRLENAVVDRFGGCKRWQYRQRIRTFKKNMALGAIPDIYEKLQVIEQILTEEHALDKIKDEKDTETK